VRAALRELRGKLGLAQDADLVAAARTRGLLVDAGGADTGGDSSPIIRERRGGPE